MIDVGTYLASHGHGTGRQEAVISLSSKEAELGARGKVDKVLDLLLQRRFLGVLCSVGVGRLGAGVGVAEAGHAG